MRSRWRSRAKLWQNRGMKFVRWFGLILIVATATLIRQAQAASFDGPWAVTLNTPEYKDPTGVVSLAYTFQFPAEVKNGVIHGEHGTKGQPAWLVIDGKIGPDGNAMLHVKGITGRREYNLAHVATGRPYEYDVKAHFAATKGSGSRIGGRLGYFTFVKE
jgi:hypothetical protein